MVILFIIFWSCVMVLCNCFRFFFFCCCCMMLSFFVVIFLFRFFSFLCSVLIFFIELVVFECSFCREFSVLKKVVDVVEMDWIRCYLIVFIYYESFFCKIVLVVRVFWGVVVCLFGFFLLFFGVGFIILDCLLIILKVCGFLRWKFFLKYIVGMVDKGGGFCVCWVLRLELGCWGRVGEFIEVRDEMDVVEVFFDDKLGCFVGCKWFLFIGVLGVLLVLVFCWFEVFVFLFFLVWICCNCLYNVLIWERYGLNLEVLMWGIFVSVMGGMFWVVGGLCVFEVGVFVCGSRFVWIIGGCNSVEMVFWFDLKMVLV